jgi:hypothetical protein
MAAISFRCTACKQQLQVAADLAGRRTHCTKCGTALVVPGESDVPPEEVKPRLGGDDEEDDGEAVYKLLEDLDKPVEDKAKKKKRKDEDEDEDEEEEEEKDLRPLGHLPTVKRKIKKKTIQFAEEYVKLLPALVLLFAAASAWGLAWMLHTVAGLLGAFQPTVYSVLMEMCTPTEPEGAKLSMPAFILGLMSGTASIGAGRAMYIAAEILALGGGGAALAAYCVALASPERNGLRGQAITLLALGGTNILLGLFLRLLPAAGAIPYVMVPLVAPEIAMNEANIERSLPLHLFWCNLPYLEAFFALVIHLAALAEPILCCVFIRSIGLAVKDDEVLEPRAHAILLIGFGQAFIFLAYFMMSITGTSEVLRLVLIVAYILWRCFFLLFLIHFALLCWTGRERLAYLIEGAEAEAGDEEEDEEDEYEEDEEDED